MGGVPGRVGRPSVTAPETSALALLRELVEHWSDRDQGATCTWARRETDLRCRIRALVEAADAAGPGEPSEDVVERCARAAFLSDNWRSSIRWETHDPDDKENYRRMARAVLEAAAHPGPEGPPEDEEGTDD